MVDSKTITEKQMQQQYGISSQKKTVSDSRTQLKPENFVKNVPERSAKGSLSSQSRILIIGYLLYFTYSASVAVDSQYLSLYYKSKGFDGALLGVLHSITPLTTFLTVPIWGMLTRAGDDGSVHCDGNKTNFAKKEASKRPFQILCLNIVISTMAQVSLALINEPVYMMVVITVAAMFQSPVKPMIDGIMMDCMEDRSNFGKIRFFSILGSGFGTNLGGRLLTMVEKSTANNSILIKDNPYEKLDMPSIDFWNIIMKTLSGFNLLFFARLTLTIPTIMFIRKLGIAAKINTYQNRNNFKPKTVSNLSVKSIDHHTPKNDKKKTTSFLSLTRDVAMVCFGVKDHLLFFLCIFIAGASGGVSDAFSYPRFQESGCSTTHMGQSRLLASCAGAMMFWYSGRITRSMGIQNILFISMICAGARFSLLKRMDHPYYVYAVDLIRSTTYGAFWSSSTLYASQIGPPTFRRTILLLLNGIYNGIGRSMGAIVGGKFQAMFGTNNLFLCCARVNYGLAFVMCFWYNYRRYDSNNYLSSTNAKGKHKIA